MEAQQLHKAYLNRDGQSQDQRYMPAIQGNSAAVDGRSTKDWLHFVKQMAPLLHYKSVDDVGRVINDGTWDEVWKLDPDQFLEMLSKEDGSLKPMQTLLAAFLYMLRFATSKVDKITDRHLQFYYSDILKLEKKAAEADHVYIIHELKKNIDEALLKEGIRYKAPKDDDEKNRSYQAVRDSFITKASLDHIKSFYKQANYLNTKPIANSLDGLGTAFEKSGERWNAFGITDPQRSVTDAGKSIEPRLLFASDLFAMKSGTRIIQIDLYPKAVFKTKERIDFSRDFSARITGEKGWIENTQISFRSSGTKNPKLSIIVQISAKEDAITNWSNELHNIRLDEDSPVLELSLNPKSLMWKVFQKLEIEDYDVTVRCEGVTDIQLENDFSRLNPDKAFYPFGNQPKKGSRFVVKIPELEGKLTNSVQIHLSWMDKPSSLETHYKEYGKVVNDQLQDSGISSDSYFKVSSSTASTEALFNHHNRSHQNSFFDLKPKSTFKAIGFKLLQDFKHSEFRTLYAERMVRLANQKEPAYLPNEPYTPLVDSIRVDYETKASKSTNRNRTQINDVSLYQATTFGYQKTDDFSKGLFFETSIKGGLLLGFNGLKANQTICLLFQMAEGSANPNKNKTQIQWEYLSTNGWQKLEKASILIDQTLSLTRSGLIKMAIPSDLASDHILMTEKAQWFRLIIHKDTDATSHLINILAHAAELKFYDQKNSSSHYTDALEAESISKFEQAEAAIKSIIQPYPSFGGKAAEDDLAFSIRVSERLRHKNRAINVWDYERMILEEFPSVYKVKCINHANTNSVLAPGHIYIVVVPKMDLQYAPDPLQPKVPLDKLEAIKNFVIKQSSFFVDEQHISVRNPSYESVKIDVDVAFSKAETGFYAKQMNEDLIQYLCPWIGSGISQLRFGNSITKSHIIAFLESLDYVDYLSDVKLYHKGLTESQPTDKTEAKASSPKSILVSAASHSINILKGVF